MMKNTLVLLLLHGASAASAQNPALESWLAGGDPLPALNQPPPDSAAVPLHYWQPDSLVRLGREWGYLREQAQAAAKLLGEREDLRRMEAEATRVVKNCDGGDKSLLGYLPDLQARLGRHRAAINALVTRASVAAVSWEEAYTRLEPSALPAVSPVQEWEALALRGEHHAVGIVVSNCTDRSRQGSLSVSGLAPAQATCQMRQQVFVEDWYLREKRRTADPLPLLERREGAWCFDLPPGGTVKLHLDLHVQPGADGMAQASAQVTVTGAEPATLRLTLRTPPVAAPVTDFQLLAFMYHTMGIHAAKPAVTADDLAAHGVTMFEFVGTPKSVFDKEGNLLSADFSAHEPYLRAYLPRGLRPMIYWIDPLRTADGEALQHPVRARAYANLLRAFLKRMKELGYGPERFVVMPVDEPHGGGYDGGEPAKHIRQLAADLKAIKEAVPELPTVLTVTYYASPPVVKAVAPHVDIFVPHWPWPDKLGAEYAPATYSPSVAFAQSIMPMMEQERAGRKATVMCYTVANGPTHALLWGNRAFPIIAFGKGFTGVGHWAYNDFKGSTWHPWDGTEAVNLDYVFVYDGTEGHPFNRAWNPTGETLVPSVRWEGLRAGIQDAHLLTWLKAALEQGRLQGEKAARARACLDTARAIAEGKTELTDAAVARLSRELREVYVASGSGAAARPR